MLNKDFYQRDANICAQELLGKLLVHKTPQGVISGMIVEVESYKGLCDAASHAYHIRSPRTEIQYHAGGLVYIYLIYGMHYCFNIVTNLPNIPEAILIRALEPVEGIAMMQTNRSTDKLVNLCSGPGKLCQALQINRQHYGYDLCASSIHIENYRNIAPDEILVSPRINIDYAGAAKNFLWRFFLQDNKYVSKHKNNSLAVPLTHSFVQQ